MRKNKIVGYTKISFLSGFPSDGETRTRKRPESPKSGKGLELETKMNTVSTIMGIIREGNVEKKYRNMQALGETVTVNMLLQQDKTSERNK